MKTDNAILGLALLTGLVLLAKRPTTEPLPDDAPPDETYGKISGIVTDSAGAAISGVFVRFVGAQDNTDSAGHYAFNNIVPATYPIKFERSGYETKTQDVALLAGENVLNVTLAVNTVKTWLNWQNEVLRWGNAFSPITDYIRALYIRMMDDTSLAILAVNASEYNTMNTLLHDYMRHIGIAESDIPATLQSKFLTMALTQDEISLVMNGRLV